MEQYIAIDNVCAWPNLTQGCDGRLYASVFNQPTHGVCEGAVDVWGSDDGRQFQWCGTPVPHVPGCNRMNHAAGLAGNGDLLVMVSGWSHRVPPGQPKSHRFDQSQVLPTVVARSSDGGRSWRTHDRFPLEVRSGRPIIPFGDIVRAANGDLAVGVYDMLPGEPSHQDPLAPDPRRADVYLLRSSDDGDHWGAAQHLAGPEHVEAALLHLGEGRWIASPRRISDLCQEIMASDDDGVTWRSRALLGVPATSASHLLRLADGRLLLVYGNRSPQNRGIDARLSRDGLFWSPPRRLLPLPDVDMGYPSAVQLRDGWVVIAYYTKQIPAHHRYHMGVLRLRPEDL